VTEPSSITGELQHQLMLTLWRLGEGSVDQVRAALPPRYQGAYTTVQTVLNRLAERGLLGRERQGRGFVYRPLLTEAEHVSQAVGRTLSSASSEARQAVLAELIGGLRPEELEDLRELAEQAARQRQRRRA
jgi:predicted transcriptional regulator